MNIDQKKVLKLKAHALKPVVWLGQQGLTSAVLAEVEIALAAHELIKVKIPGVDREARNVMINEIMALASAELIQSIGQIATFYRKKTHVSSRTSATPSQKC